MKGKSPVEIRVELARGHFLVGEPAYAIAALEAAIREDPRHPGLRALLDELIADPATMSTRASLEGLRARLGASVPPLTVAPVPVAPVVKPRPAPVEVEAAEAEFELEPLAASAGLHAKPALAAVRPAPARPAAPQPVAVAKAAPVAAPVARVVPAVAGPVQTAERARARTLAELERWLRNVPRIKREEVRA